MTLVVDAVLIVGVVAVGRMFARRKPAPKEREVRAPAPAPPAPIRLDGFPCKLGDVVLRAAERDEAWLAGALVFLEAGPVAALFIAPEAGGDRAIFARRAGGLAWLAPLAAGVVLVGREPPHAIEHGGARFERERRLPVRVERVGTGAPAVGATAIVAEYAAGPRERLVVVVGAETTLAWRGAALSEGEYEVLPGRDPAGD